MKHTLTYFVICLFFGIYPQPVHAQSGLARIKSLLPDGKLNGRMILKESPQGTKVQVNIFEAPPGKHGIHIHEFGDCEGDGTNAGSHFNPEGSPHGHIAHDGIRKAHAGDLGNIDVKADGSGSLDMTLSNLTLTVGRHNIAGRSIIIHEHEDDFSQPLGNAGGRIACGTIVITGD